MPDDTTIKNGSATRRTVTSASIAELVDLMEHQPQPPTTADELAASRVARTRRAVETRMELARTVLASAETLHEYLGGCPAGDRRTKRISEDVAARASTINALEKSGADEYSGLTAASVVQQFLALAATNNTDWGESFGLPAFTICELVKLLHSKLLTEEQTEFVLREIERRVGELSEKWFTLTGAAASTGPTALAPGSFVLEDLLSMKAPVAVRPSWSEEIANSEARFHKQHSGRQNQNPHELIERYRTSGFDRGGFMGDRDTSDGGRLANELWSSPTMRTDQELGHANAEQLYSFPGKLGVREDIFFDYSVILPVTDCSNPTDCRQTMPVEWTAVKIAAAQARAILNDRLIDHTLGSDLKPVIAEVLDATEALSPSAEISPAEARLVRRRLRQAASSIRLLRSLKLEVSIAPQTSDVAERRAELQQRLTELDYSYRIRTRDVPSEVAPRQEKLIEARTAFTTYSTPPSVSPSGDAFKKVWSWGDETEEFKVSDWIGEVADKFLPRLDAFKGAVNDLLNEMDNFLADYSQPLSPDTEAERFLNRRVFRLRSSLARILDELAQIVPTTPVVPAEGSKRLALQLIYRQRWIPDGYIRGKLVGHKNLPPASEESFKRRTFIKTHRETSTVTNFAATMQRDHTSTLKETSEAAREITEKFALKASSSGDFNFTVGANFGGGFSAETSTSYDLSQVGRAVQTMLAESVLKASQAINEKKEVKMSEVTESEDEFESVFTVRNANDEITANYFYYQLLRQYLVTVELADIRPVLLRVKEIPSAPEIDETFLGHHAHILAEALPRQLAVDLIEVIDDIEALGRRLTHTIADADDREAAYEAFRSSNRPHNDPEGGNPTAGDDWDERLASHERLMVEARAAAIDAEEVYLGFMARLSRVKAHVRKNRAFYMQHIWSSEPSEDDDMLLEQESFAGMPLPQVTRGLIREGFHGQEEIFTYNGPSLALAELLANNMVAGTDIATEEALRDTALFQQLARFYSDGEPEALIERITAQCFVADPTPEDEVLSSRNVQIAQDAVVVETMPGQVPLLEAYQMAHRQLVIERETLNNEHLRGRVLDHTWEGGTDTLTTYRRMDSETPGQASTNPPSAYQSVDSEH